MRLSKIAADHIKPLHWPDDDDDSTPSQAVPHNSDWLVDHTGYTDADDNAIDMLDVMHTLPDPT